MRTAWLIRNPVAGRYSSRRVIERAVRVLKGAGWELRTHHSQSGSELQRMAGEAARQGCQAVFIAGGDGSVGLAARALMGTETALAVLPTGTSNVWAKELGLQRIGWTKPGSPVQAARRLAHGVVASVDVGICDRRAFLLWAGAGLDGRVVNALEPRKRWERPFVVLRYIAELVRSSIGWGGISLTVRADGKVWRGQYVLAVASNIRSYAGGMVELTPEARVDDGLLDFWLLGGRSAGDIALRAWQILSGKHMEAPGVVGFRAAEAVFECDSDMVMQHDGEPWVGNSSVRFSVRRRALRVLLPEGSHPPILTSLG